LPGISILMLLMLLFSQPPFARVSQASESAAAVPLRQSEVARLTLQSDFMGFSVPYRVYLPKGYAGGEAYPVWYGLHGHSSSETMWLQTAGIGETADELIQNGDIRPLIMVFPFVRYDSSITIREDMKDGIRGESQSERFICEELIPYIDSHYHTIRSPESRYIGGLSMGGLFALQAAFHHPDLFGKVGAYSPALIYSDFSGTQLEKWLYPGAGKIYAGGVSAFIKEQGLETMQVYLDCGSNGDPFAAGIQSLCEVLRAGGVSVELCEYNGGHSLQDGKVKDYLRFYTGIGNL
jgi:enterochelin esterase-like enzyme